jgi:hypothetical protein
MASLQEIRAKLKEQENRASGANLGGDNSIFPFWNMAEGQTSTIRYLPDADNNNTFFWVERLMIKLPFAGIKGETDSRPVQVQVPCMEMYNESCPILAEVRTWFKDSSLEEMGRKYWKKKSYIFQGFVVSSDMKEDSIPENPIRRFIIGPQIFKLVKQALLDPDLESTPTDYTSGLDFRLSKGNKGGFADYSTSNWARRERPLSDAEMKAVNTFGLFNLKDFLPKKPNDVDLRVLTEMFEASVDGEPYDKSRWGQYFKPAGMNAATGDPSNSNNESTFNKSTNAVSTTSSKSKVTVDEDDDIPFKAEPAPAPTKQEAPKSAAANNAQDILAMIRARQNKQ